MQRVIVTGATSMIGAALIKECIKNKVETLAIVRKGCTKLGRLMESAYMKVVECDLEQLSSMKIQDQYDVCYHFAWAYPAREVRDDPVLQEKNIRYTLDAVQLAAKAGCKKFIGAGSQAEYGPREGMITPNTEINPQLSYGMAKSAAGMLSGKLCGVYGMTHIWGRIFSVYGCNDNEGTMLTYAIDQFLKGESAKFSSAVQMWDYLYEDDAGKIFYLLGERVERNSVYCIANGAYRPLKEFIYEMKDAFGPGAKCEFEVETGRLSAGLQPDVNALLQDIAYKPEVTFKEGITKMIAHRTKMFKGGGKRFVKNVFPAPGRTAA